MNIDTKNLKKKLKKLWKTSKKDFENMTKEASVLLAKGEKHLKKVSKQSQVKLELINATLKREKLCYQLGKAVAGASKTQWTKSKKITSLLKEISKLAQEIKKLNSKV